MGIAINCKSRPDETEEVVVEHSSKKELIEDPEKLFTGMLNTKLEIPNDITRVILAEIISNSKNGSNWQNLSMTKLKI